MKPTRWMVLSLLTCGALTFGCADASDEEITDETSDDAASPDDQDITPTPCDGKVDMSTRESALAAYACLREARDLEATVNRRGKPLTISFPIE